MTFGNTDLIAHIVLGALFFLFLTLCYFVLRIYAVNKYFNKIINIKKYYIHLSIHFILIVSIIISFSLLILKPRWGTHLQRVQSRNADLIVALDVSRSMLVRENNETRLDRAKRAAMYAVSNFNGRAGLVLFAGDAFMQTPLTTDKGAFKMFLDSASVDSIQLQGTNVSAAIEEAARVFDKKSITHRVVLLITDGEEHELSVQKIVHLAKKNDISVFTAAIGSQEPQPIPLSPADTKSFMEDSSGKAITSAADRSFLKSLSTSTSGKFIDLDRSFSGLNELGGGRTSQEGNSLTDRYIEVADEKYYFFSFLVVIVLLGELLFTSRRVRL